MKIKLELNQTEALVVLSALTEFALHPDHEKDKDIAENVSLDIRKSVIKAFREEIIGDDMKTMATVEKTDDGTLIVHVQEGEGITRVLVVADDHHGDVFYPDAD